MILLNSVVKSKAAFTLIELMAAVVIVGVLVTLAVPRFRVFIAKARQGEAHFNLDLVAKLQQTYFNQYQKYYQNADGSKFNMGGGGDSGSCTGDSAANELGFRVTDCAKLRYSYSAKTAGGGGRAINDGSTTKDIYPGCTGTTFKDEWLITIKRDLTNPQNVIKECQE